MLTKTLTRTLIAALLISAQAGEAALLNVVNPSFEDDPNNFNEFFLGEPNGWTLIDPGGIASAQDTPGTLTATGSPFYNSGAPDGDNVAILFIGEDVGTTEFGLGQVLADPLAANTRYQLSVEVGNIQSGAAQSGTSFDLSGFPGYRIDLLAGGVVLASASDDINAPIAEGEFATVILEHISSAAPAQLGQALELRLTNLNLSNPAFTGADLEVNFDDVVLDASPTGIPLPASWTLMLLGAGLAWRRQQTSRAEGARG